MDGRGRVDVLKEEKKGTERRGGVGGMGWDRLSVDGNAGWTRNGGKRSECVRSTPRIRVMGKSIRNRANKVTVQDVRYAVKSY